MKPILAQLLLFGLFAMLAGCRAERTNCYTCIEACAPFAVAVCEPYPAARFGDPITCSCNPYQRIDTPPVIAPVKGGK